ncbi:hypothetical protein BVX94_01570 [bacterium B17]|nr:hypothetical protein BVX94_01570 [bacterium B17]
MRSSSGRFVVTGTNSIESVYISRWADKTTSKIEDMLNIKMPFRHRLVRIAISTTTGEKKGQKPPSWVTVSQGILGNRFEQGLVIYNYDNKKRDLALCHLLMNGYVRSWDFKKWPLAGIQDDTPSYSLYQVPLWLSCGIKENIMPKDRESNSNDVVVRWMDGTLPPLSSVIVPQSRFNYAQKTPDEALCGVFVSWLLSVPKSRVLFGDIFSRLADGKEVSLDWLAQKIPGCGSRTKMSEAWDWWLNGEKRRIYKPGTTSLAAIKDLQSELLIYPTNFGISRNSGLPKVVMLSELVNLRNEEWVKKAAASKSISVKLTAAGRGKDFIAVADLYCDFFDLLTGKGSKKELKVALAIAETARKSLIARYQAEKSGK